MLRRLALVPVLITSALLVSASLPLANGVAATAHPIATTTPTAQVSVRPVDASGHLAVGYKVTHSRGGAQCDAGSEAVGDSAYRCFAGNGVYDPCWVAAGRSHVFCLAAPWSFQVARLKVRKYDNAGLSKHPDHSIPWGVQLANGVQCELFQGATSTVHGMRVNYGCHRVKYVLVGKLNRSHAEWRIRKAHPTSGGHYKLTGWVGLTKAWFGKPSRKG